MFGAPKPRFRLYTRWRGYPDAVGDALLGRFHSGPGIEETEAKLCTMLDVPHAVCVPMARVGIYLTIKHLIRPGQKVILSSYTIADVVNMVIAAGGRPVFADIERHTCNIDPNQVEDLLDADTGAVLITHLHGLAAPAIEIREMCERQGVPLIEDAAQAFGARLEGRSVGTFGEAGVFSFGMYKNVNAWYGGAVVSKNKDLVDDIRKQLSQFGYQSRKFVMKRMRKGLLTDLATCPAVFKSLTFWVFRYGFLNGINWINRRVQTELDLERHDELPPHYLANMTPYQARLVLSQLDNVARNNQIRIEYAQQYHKGLAELDGLVLPPLRTDSSHVYTYYPIQYENRSLLLKWLMRNNCDVAAQHLKNCADLPAFTEFYRDCPNARKTAGKTVLLPTYPRYGQHHVFLNIATVGEFTKMPAPITTE